MNPQYGGVIWTNHAIKRLYERRITQSDAWYSFKHPDGQLPGRAPGSKRYYKNYGRQRIEIIATQNEKREWVILSCWSKLMGTGKSVFPRKENIYLAMVQKIIRRLRKKKKEKKLSPDS
jgi:hypothetical protein